MHQGKYRLLAALLMIGIICQAQTTKENFDFGWKFNGQDIKEASLHSFDDASWQSIDLPHDWDIFHSPSSDGATGNDGGYYPGGTGWYRKSFNSKTLQISEGQTLCLHFEGVYQRCQVYVNGTLAASHAYGYTPFRADITELVNANSNNVVAVRVDNSAQPNCRWYSGSGIYRHVWLESYGSGTVDATTADDPLKLYVFTERIYGMSADGTHADSASISINYDGLPSERRVLKDIKLWSPDNPVLYDVHYGKLTVKHGFRTVEYDAKKGLRLNGQPTLINGACIHHDDGVLGAMAFDAAEIRKVRLMKEAGFNLLRTSHNPQTRAFMDACDSLGMMVIDEVFDGWYSKKTAHDHHEELDACYREDIDALVLRDRNHPCVICWSIGNEVIERKEIKVIQTAKKFRERVLLHDATRPVTEALCTWDREWEIFDPHAAVLDIVGYNYLIHKAPGDHERCPERVIWQTESYPRDAFSNWDMANRNSYIIGDIVWTGLDYLGESGIGQFYYDGEPTGEHYQGRHFPFHGAYCGDVDMTGWRKPISHYRDMLWNEKEGSKFIYMAVKEPEGYYGSKIHETSWSVWPTWESWNWKGWEGKDIEVEIYTKAPSVNLYLNGRRIATQEVSRETEYKATIKVPYRSGTLRATAVNAQGKEYAETTLRTAGSPAAVRLTTDRTTLTADGEDLAYITAEIVDKNGKTVPDSDRQLTVTIEGAATLLSAASADFKDLEPMTSPTVKTYKGRALIVLRSTHHPGPISVTVSTPSLKEMGTVLLSDIK